MFIHAVTIDIYLSCITVVHLISLVMTNFQTGTLHYIMALLSVDDVQPRGFVILGVEIVKLLKSAFVFTDTNERYDLVLKLSSYVF